MRRPRAVVSGFVLAALIVVPGAAHVPPPDLSDPLVGPSPSPTPNADSTPGHTAKAVVSPEAGGEEEPRDATRARGMRVKEVNDHGDPSCEDGEVTVDGNWTSIRVPAFPEGQPQRVRSYAIDPVTPERLYVTNGMVILASHDGGCTWDLSYPGEPSAVDDVVSGLPVLGGTIDNVGNLVVVPGEPGRPHRVLATKAGPGGESGADYASAGVLVSPDDGRSWRLATTGLPPIPYPYSMSQPTVTASGTAYMWVAHSPGPWALYRSSDAGDSWTRVGQDAAPLSGDPRGGRTLAVDPDSPQTLWAGASSLARSDDGGETWTTIDDDAINAPVSGIDVLAVEGQSSHIAVAHGAGVSVSRDGGRTWFLTPGAPFQFNVVTVAHRGSPKELMAVARTRSSEALLYGYDEASRGWLLVPGSDQRPFTTPFDLNPDGADPPAVYGLSPPWSEAHPDFATLEKYTGPTAPDPGRLFDGNRGQGGSQGCPPRQPTIADRWTEQVPVGSAPIYVSNFDTGQLVRYDRFGNAEVVGLLPWATEGMALDPLGRVVIAGRWENRIYRFDGDTCTPEVVSRDVSTNEGPSFGPDGTLYISNNNANDIYAFPAPVVPFTEPERIWDFPPGLPYFIEDTKVAPPESPYAGDVFVLFEFGGVGRLRKTPTGWQRMDDFIPRWPSPAELSRLGVPADACVRDRGFGPTPIVDSVGMAFLPDGSLIVPIMACDGVVLKYAPDGGGYELFAFFDDRRLELGKVDATPDGYVFIGAGRRFNCGGDARLIRLDPNGRRLTPDFTQHLTCAVGIAVPHAFLSPSAPGPPKVPPVLSNKTPDNKPEQLLVPRPEVPVRGAAVAPLLPANPPPQPNPGPAPVPAPVPAPAPAPAQAPASAQAGQPQAIPVPQQQEQPQPAVVRAANHIRERLAMEYQMVRRDSVRDPLDAVKLGLNIGVVSLIALFGVVSLRVARARTQIHRAFSSERRRR